MNKCSFDIFIIPYFIKAVNGASYKILPLQKGSYWYNSINAQMSNHSYIIKDKLLFIEQLHSFDPVTCYLLPAPKRIKALCILQSALTKNICGVSGVEPKSEKAEVMNSE